MKPLGGYLLTGAGLVASLALLHATPLSLTVQPIQVTGEVLTAPPDSTVQIVAEAQGLAPVASADLPSDGGTFWWVLPGAGIVPMPFPPQDQNAPIYDITGDGQQFLVDDTGGQVVVNTESAGLQAQATDSAAVTAEVSAESDAVLNLIEQVQDTVANQQFTMLAQAVGMDDSGPPSFGDGGDGGTNTFTPSFSGGTPINTNGLWLQITNYDGNFAYLNLMNGTDYVYCVESATSLPGGWQVETELFPTDGTDQTNVLPFTVATLDRQNLLLRAMDWTGVTENGNTTPDWWFWEYFGTTALSDTNLDSQGNTLGYDYQYGLDPNIINFTIESANQYVNTTVAGVQLDLAAGVPSYYAVLINDTNLADANWQAYAGTNLTVALGATDGIYTLLVGLRGLPTVATPTWDSYRFTLDRVPPVVTITNPVIGSGAVTKPYLQLQGFANEPLASLSYDISNALGVATNQNVFVTDQSFDTNQFDFTTNYFQAYDVPLATNDNYITLRVTDRAGNTTTTNFDMVLDYTGATNPPVVALIWPQDGMAVSGTNITIRGLMSDETGTIAAQIIDDAGNTNEIQGTVERNDMFWIENVPLNGTNQITLQATDAAGNVTTTNFTVIPSDISLTIDSTPTGDALYQGYGSVSGTVSDPTATVTVNGVAVTNDYWTDGVTWYWAVDGVPIYGQGTATFDAQAANSSSPTANTSTPVEMGAYVLMTSYHGTEIQNYAAGDYFDDFQVTKDMAEQASVTPDGQWAMTDTRTNDSTWETSEYDSEIIYRWSAFSPVQGTEQIDDMGYDYDGPAVWPDDGLDLTVLMAMPHEDQTWGEDWGVVDWVGHYYATGVAYHWNIWPNATLDLSVDAKTEVKVLTGGKALVSRQNLFQISAWANEIQRPPTGGMGYPWWEVPTPAIDPTKLVVAGKAPGADGNVWLALPDNSPGIDITVNAPGKEHFDAGSGAQKYHLRIGLVTSTTTATLDTDTPEVCVGQTVLLGANWQEGDPGYTNVDGIRWHLPDKYVNEAYPYSSTCTSYRQNTDLLTNVAIQCWYVNLPGGTCSVRENLHFANGQSVNIAAAGAFTVYRPQMTQFTNYPPFIPMLTNGWVELGLDGYASPGNTNFDGNMNFRATVETKTNFPGDVNWTQLNDRNVDFVPIQSTGGYFELDNSEFFGGNVTGDPTNQTISFIDNPGISTTVWPNVNITDYFQTYLRFKPDGDGIWVTLGFIPWGWSEDEWLGTTIISSGTNAPIYINIDDFPVWSAVTHSSPGT